MRQPSRLTRPRNWWSAWACLGLTWLQRFYFRPLSAKPLTSLHVLVCSPTPWALVSITPAPAWPPNSPIMVSILVESGKHQLHADRVERLQWTPSGHVDRLAHFQQTHCGRNVTSEVVLFQWLHLGLTLAIWRPSEKKIRRCWPTSELPSAVMPARLAPGLRALLVSSFLRLRACAFWLLRSCCHRTRAQWLSRDG